MDTLPPAPRPFPLPVPDPRACDVALDYADMDALVAGLVLPDEASMHVMSALETSRELIRHSYYRYEFATVAVSHSLYALEHMLAERTAGDEPLRDLIERAVEAGLVPAELAAVLDRGRVLRDDLTRGVVTSGAVHPTRAITIVRAVFDAVALLRRPSSAVETRSADEGGEARRDGLLGRLWAEHRRASFPASFRGVDIAGVELILLDADVAGLVSRELSGGLDGDGIAVLWACIADLDKIVPLLNEEYCASYFSKLRTIANLAVARYLPTAT
ncbi:hypothetical protein ACIBSV_20615 [Embleya sp. NPDC050154]|uniref:hypothetical protein n=1 Tax=Embleya sp. NPDC050154 TaxID=3363988 RepID=UPI00379927FB